ncbi:MAG: ribonuclease P protein subunit [Desulfurococcaceae archaeon]
MRTHPNRENIYYHELIGLKIRILQYPDEKVVGLEGIVVDETLKILVIEKADKSVIKVFKANGIFEFTLPNGEKVIIKGIDMIGRPWDRLKKLLMVKR